MKERKRLGGYKIREQSTGNFIIEGTGEPVVCGEDAGSTEMKQIIGQRIRELRRARHLTQSELASHAELKISQASLAAYETGAREPGMGTIAALASFFRVSTDFLFGLTLERGAVADPSLSFSEKAAGFLHNADGDLWHTVDAMLSADAAAGFLEALRSYVLACHPAPEDLAGLLPVADHINEGADAEQVALEMLTGYKKKLLDQSLAVLCEELVQTAGCGGLDVSTEISKGGARNGNSGKTGK